MCNARLYQDLKHNDMTGISCILPPYLQDSRCSRGHTMLYGMEHQRNKKIHFDNLDTLRQLTEAVLSYEYKPLMQQVGSQMEQDETQSHPTYTNSANPGE